MPKYFKKDDDELCYSESSIIEEMKKNGIAELEVIEAKRTIANGYFFCTYHLLIGESGQVCGKICPAYQPRNGKSGCCTYREYTYEHTDRSKILTAR